MKEMNPAHFSATTSTMNNAEAAPIKMLTGLTGGVSISMIRRGSTPDTT